MNKRLIHSSVDVAKSIGVAHDNMLRTCEKYTKEFKEEFNRSTHITSRNRKYPFYEMSDKALFLVVKSATSVRAMRFFDIFFDYIQLGFDADESIKIALDEIKLESNIKREYKTYILRGLNTGLFKIGKTSKPIDLRLKQIQGNSGEYLELICSIESDIEAKLHKELDEKKTNSEWFKLDKKDFEKIKRTYAKKLTLYDTIDYMLYCYYGNANKGTKLESVKDLVGGRQTVENMNKVRKIVERDYEANLDCELEVNYNDICKEIRETV